MQLEYQALIKMIHFVVWYKLNTSLGKFIILRPIRCRGESTKEHGTRVPPKTGNDSKVANNSVSG